MGDTNPEEIDVNQSFITELFIHQKACRDRDELRESVRPRPTSSASSLATNSNTLVSRPLSLAKVDTGHQRTQRSGPAPKSPIVSTPAPAWPLAEDQIRVELKKWTRFFQRKAELVRDQHEIIRIIVEYFIDVAARKGLGGSSAAQILRNCLTELEARITAGDEIRNDIPAAKCGWELRIGQRSIAEVERDMAHGVLGEAHLQSQPMEGKSSRQLRCQNPSDSNSSPSTSLIDQIPLFNLWDSLSFIYTKAVEPIRDQLHAELHIYQFWVIVCILRNCQHYFVLWAMPSTAAATWTKPGKIGEPYIIAFATTCVGPRKQAIGTKQGMQQLRLEHLARLKKTLGIADPPVGRYPGLDGNCPENITLGVISGPGRYVSHCLARKGESVKSMKFCKSCETQAGLFDAHGIEIIDLWEGGTLVDSTNPGNMRVGEGTEFLFCYVKPPQWVIQTSIEGGYEEDDSYHDFV
jgi:hypothetical protein